MALRFRFPPADKVLTVALLFRNQAVRVQVPVLALGETVGHPLPKDAGTLAEVVTWGSNIWTLRSAGDRLLDTQEATGSNPVVSTRLDMRHRCVRYPGYYAADAVYVGLWWGYSSVRKSACFARRMSRVQILLPPLASVILD